MSMRLAFAVCVLVVAAWSAAPVADGRQDGAFLLAVSHRVRASHPGEVAVVAVESPHPIAAVEGEALGRPIHFWRVDDEGRTWQGFVGIGLETPPGRHEVVVRATNAHGITAAHWMPLVVEPARFETRQLRVEERFVSPPAAEQARIARDATVLANVFRHSAPDRLWRGPFTPPVPGPSTSAFGRLTVLNGQPRGRHQGADFRAAQGTPVRAPNAGRVVLAADLYFAGNTVVLDHGLGLFSLFAHLSHIAVTHGALVSQGDLLGDAGATGRVTGPHLHWALRLWDVSLDPVSLMTILAGPAPTSALLSRP